MLSNTISKRQNYGDAGRSWARHCLAVRSGCSRWRVSRYRNIGGPMARALRKQEPVRNQRIVIERPDGGRVSVLVNADPLYDEDGILVGAVNCFRDVTELRRAYQELQRSKEDLEDFFENGAVGLHIVSSDGAILRANKAIPGR